MARPGDRFSDDELLAYLDEHLSVDRAAQIEAALRGDPDLRQRTVLLIRRRDQGGHTVGEIWRRRRLSCPTRTQLGSWLLGALDDAWTDYIEFHLQTIGCRICAANIEDLRRLQSGPPDIERRRRLFASSVGGLTPQGAP